MKTIKVPKDTKIAVYSDIHAHSEQFFKLMEAINPSEKMWVVSCGDFHDKGFGDEATNLILDKMLEYHNYGYGFSVKGNHCLKFLKKNKTNYNNNILWLKSRPLSLSFEFYNGNRLTIVHAGITPNMTLDDLDFNVEVAYVRDIDDKGMISLKWIKDINGDNKLVKSREGGCSWHEKYDGRFGFICAGHQPNKDGKPKFYNYSCNLDCAVFETGILSAQIFTPEGNLGELLTVTGAAFKPKLNENY